MTQDLGQRVAKLEAENDLAKPLHDSFTADIKILNDRTARIETKVDTLLKNGKGRHWGEAGAIAGIILLMAGIAAVFRYYGV